MPDNKRNNINVFLRDVAPILLMFKVAGGLAFSENYDCVSKKYSVRLKFASLWTVSSALMNGLQIYVIVFLFMKAYKNFSSLEEVEHISGLSFIFNLFAPMTSPALIGIQLKRSLKYFERWLDFQEKIASISLTTEPLALNIHKICIGVVMWATFVAVLLFLGPFALGASPDYVDLIQIVGMFYSVNLFCFFFVACKAAKAASSRILLEFNNLAECNELGKFHRELEAVALSFRPVWLQMANMMQFTGSCNSLAFGGQFVISFLLAFSCFYAIVSSWTVLSLEGVVLFSVGSSLNIAVILVICTAGQQLYSKVKSDFIEAITVTKKLRMSKAAKRMIESFLIHISDIVPPLHLDSYIQVDRGLLAALIFAFFSNTVILVQMRIGGSSISSPEKMMALTYKLFA